MTRLECEIKFLNSAYLSELWAARDLESFLAFCPKEMASQVENQIEDEYRHSAQIKRSILNAGFPVEEDLTLSMQKNLHFRFGIVPEKSYLQDHALLVGFHELMERRAVWNYRTALRTGMDKQFHSLLKQILQDEKSHIDGFSANWAHPTLQLWKNQEYEFFRTRLPRAYGLGDHVHNTNFWDHYFKRSLDIP